MKKFNLITSSNIKLWNKTKTNLLVGDWCLLNLDKKKINKYKYKVLPYHWNNLKKKKKDIKYINKIIKIISRELVNFLNEYHNSNFSYGYWKILLFPWLYLWVGFVFDRWEIVKNIKNVKNLSQKFSNYDSKDFILNNSRSLILSAQTNPWNEWIFSKILNFFNKENYNLKKKKFTLIDKLQKSNNFFLKYFLNYIFCFKKNIFFTNVTFKTYYKILLLLTFGQFGSLNFKYDIGKYKLTQKRFKIKFKKTSNDNFLNFLKKILPYQIPKFILEGHNDINLLIKKTNLPKKPKAIVTSYEHYYNEFFKVYVANKVKDYQTKFIIMQHGSSGIDLFNVGYEQEIKISDRFLSMGKHIVKKKVYPFFSTLTSNTIIKKEKNSDGLLICMFDFGVVPNKISNHPVGLENIDYYVLNIINFIKALPINIIQNSKIKFRQIHENSYVFKKLNYYLRINKIKLEIYDNKSQRIYEESKNYKLVIETINSTGFLEEMNLNIPALLLLNKNLYHFKSNCKKDFHKLKKNNILHLRGKNCAEFIIKNYNNVNNWWNSKKIQSLIKSFCNKYSRSSNDPLNDIRKSLNFDI